LSAADSRRFPCWGEKSFTVSIGGIPRRWGFLLAEVSFPIIGINFLRHHGLLLDVANLHLLPGSPLDAPAAPTTDQAVAAVQPLSYTDVVRGIFSPSPGGAPAASSFSPPPSGTPLARPPPPAATRAVTDWLACLHSRFPAVFAASLAVSLSHPPHGVQHFITTVGQPSTAKFRRLDPVRLAAAKAEFQVMLDEGVIRRSCSQWSSPLHMVKKKDDSWLPCGDYRTLNLQTLEDKYPLPNMADLVARLDGCTVFSKLD
jgi:cleavage and polyadenylation specificity factor subunit 1